MSKMKLHDIKYPIYPIRACNKVYEKNGIIYVETHLKTWIADNKNLAGENLAKRRLKFKDPYPLNTCIFNLAQMIRYKSFTNMYLDREGKLFKYQKRNRAKLEYKKILSYTQKGDLVAFIVKDINTPIYAGIMTLEQYKQSENEELYLGLLWINNSWIFYDTSYKPKKETWRKY